MHHLPHLQAEAEAEWAVSEAARVEEEAEPDKMLLKKIMVKVTDDRRKK
jgi:hypothetical protein